MIPVPAISIAAAGILYASSASLMVAARADLNPFYYAAIASITTAIPFAIAGIIATSRSHLRLSALTSRHIRWKHAAFSASSRTSYVLFIIAGPFLHYAVIVAMMALIPATLMTATWLTRNRESRPAAHPAFVAITVAISIIGAFLCLTAQPGSTHGTLHIFQQPLRTAFGLTLTIASITAASTVPCGYSFWIHNRDALSTELTPQLPHLPATAVTAWTFAAGAALITPVVLILAHLTNEPTPSAYAIAIAATNGITTGSGLMLYAYGSHQAKSLITQNLLQLEPALGIIIMMTLSIARQLNWTMLLVGITLITITAIAATTSENRASRRHRKSHIA